jgi:hypothetical protein
MCGEIAAWRSIIVHAGLGTTILRGVHPKNVGDIYVM